MLPLITPSTPLHTCRCKTPFGMLRLGCSDDDLLFCEFERSSHRQAVSDRILQFTGRAFREVPVKSDGILHETARQLAEYFDGRRRHFDLPLGFIGTDFERSVWEAILDIPFGHLDTCTELATSLGRPQSASAVGRAAWQSPFSVIVPLHRLLGHYWRPEEREGEWRTFRTLLTLEGARPACRPDDAQDLLDIFL
ncbi:methylated-DNA--[protein]-cysteine S-methyltransferase [Sutterella sp.]|uniref:methylated-DNA--[protein]-cysteine S-methyltransferase n=1 Tax=Sutterella sp. TaxID=1981025 RepID=UPI0026DEC471|nr:methylated-DNA--[protein]-cysteine S-methyltransferase [Sutterella sp.]MDO5532502.1 methylated-DNA--[protein]-cysteine S-methyltransferase [Sutterella sp.]